jgi:hypothetical protein
LLKKEKNVISEEQKLKNIELVLKLIKNFPDGRRERVEQMFESIGDEYFTAPASSREDFHNAFPGGLCDHSLSVVKNLWRLQKDLCPDRWEKETLTFVGLFHDLGKVGVNNVPRYITNPNAFQRREWGKIYKTNPEMPFLTIDDATCFIFQKYGINLSYEEYLAIRLADGQYEPSNKPYSMREPDLGLLLHWADLWATKEEKARTEKTVSS